MCNRKKRTENNTDAESNADDSDSDDGNGVQDQGDDNDDKNSNEQAKLHVQCALPTDMSLLHTQLNVDKFINTSVTLGCFFAKMIDCIATQAGSLLGVQAD